MRKFALALFLVAASASAQYTNFDHHATASAGHANGLPAASFVGPYSGTPVLGDMIVFNGTNWVSIAAGTNGQVLTENTNGLPTWQAAGGGSVAFSAVTAGTNTAALLMGTGGSLGTSGSGTITATAVPVGGISGLGSGVGTWLATPTAANFASALSGSVTVPAGGTGAGTFTAHGVLLGEGASAFGVTAVGTTGQCLTGNTGADPTWSTCGSGFVNLQASTPGTQQGGSGAGNINTNGNWIEELDAITNVANDGIVTQNTTAALVGAQLQFPPSIKMCGTAWNTGGSASETDCFRIQNQLAAGNPTTQTFRLLSSVAGGAFTAPMTLSSAGALTVTGGITFTGSATGTANNTQFVVSGSTAGVGGLLVNYQNSGSGLVTGNRFVSVACSSGTTCDSGTNLPANAVVLSVAYRITTAVTGATTIELGTATNATAFCTGLTTLTVNTTGVCGGGATVGSGVNGAAVAVRATATAGTFSAGVIEYEITYILATPPTS